VTKWRSNLTSWRWWLGLRSKEVLAEPPQMSVTVIVPAFNEAKHIAATVQSLQHQTYLIKEIIVVDDCSTDNTGEIARSLGVTVIRTPMNKGSKAQAQGFGLDLVKTELFVTVDADTILASNAIYEAMRFFNDNNTEVVCGTVVPQRLNTAWELGRLVEYLYAQAIMKPAQDQHGLVLVASGCFSIFRTKTVKELGGFDERTMAEDMDLTWQIHENGGRVYFATKAVCYPVDPPNRRIYCAQMDRWYRGFIQNMKVRNYKPFPRKWSMRTMVYIYLVWFAISALITPLFLYAITTNILMTLLWMLIMNSVLVWLPALVVGKKLGVPVLKIVYGFLPYLILPYINMFILCSVSVERDCGK